jgi:hypothetical protein
MIPNWPRLWALPEVQRFSAVPLLTGTVELVVTVSHLSRTLVLCVVRSIQTERPKHQMPIMPPSALVQRRLRALRQAMAD